jgi:hypothetical protein
MFDAWTRDEFALDPTRITLVCGKAGYDGTAFKGLLADRYDIQINKTSRNSILLQTNINNTRSDVAHIVKVLADIARKIDDELRKGGEPARKAFAARVKSLMEDVPELPNFSQFQASFRDDPKSATSEGHMREAFYASYRAENCEYLPVNSPDMDKRVKKGPEVVAADFVIPIRRAFDHGPGSGRHRGYDRVHAQTRCERDTVTTRRSGCASCDWTRCRHANAGRTVSTKRGTDPCFSGCSTRFVPIRRSPCS